MNRLNHIAIISAALLAVGWQSNQDVADCVDARIDTRIGEMSWWIAIGEFEQWYIRVEELVLLYNGCVGTVSFCDCINSRIDSQSRILQAYRIRLLQAERRLKQETDPVILANLRQLRDYYAWQVQVYEWKIDELISALSQCCTS